MIYRLSRRAKRESKIKTHALPSQSKVKRPYLTSGTDRPDSFPEKEEEMHSRKSVFPGFPGFLAIVFVGLLTLLALSPGQKIKITSENGVTVVRNPETPVPQPGGPAKLILKQDLVIGKEPTSSGYLFAELRSVGVDDQENIWTLDWEDIKVRVFDKNGKIISTFGKKGQGPEEWQNPSRMFVTRGGTGVILDLNKITFYSRDGRCLKEMSTARSNPFRLKIDSKGNIYADTMEFREKMILRLIKYDPEMNPIATVAETEIPFKMGAINPFPTLLLCHVTGDDRLIWMVNSIYEFHVLGPDGKLIRKISKDYKPVNVTAADQKRILEEQYGDVQYRSQLVFPDVFPPLFYFVGDAEGRLYVQTYETDGKGGLWFDVFDAEGRCITRFSLPREEMAFAVSKNKLYAMIQADEEGVPLVKRYTMEWK
jgi:hypothetical protein